METYVQQSKQDSQKLTAWYKMVENQASVISVFNYCVILQ